MVLPLPLQEPSWCCSTMLLSREILLLFAGGNRVFGKWQPGELTNAHSTGYNSKPPGSKCNGSGCTNWSCRTLHHAHGSLPLHPLRNIPPSPTQWDIPQIQPTMAHFITPWRHPNYKCESVCVWYGCVSYCLLLFQEGSCAVLCVSLCWLVLVCTYYLNLGEKARIPYPFFMPAAVSRRFLCWFVFVLELVCSCLYLLLQS